MTPTPIHPGRTLRADRPSSSFVALPFGLAVILALSLAGCATGEYAYRATIAGGEKVSIPLDRGAAALAKEGSIQVLKAGGDVNEEKHQFYYKFSFSDSSGQELRSVLIEDVSEETAVPLLEDLQPKLTDRRWDGASVLFNRDDPHVKWIFYVGDSFRVFRLTVTFADGRTIKLYQGSRVPSWAKVSIRATYGEKY